LQDTQQFRLQGSRDVTDFVQEESTFIVRFEAPDLLRNCAGKGTFLMTEQLAFYKIQRNGRAIEFYKSAPTAMTCIVNRMCDEFLSRAGFPLDKDSRVCGRDLLHLVENRFQSGALADDSLESSLRAVYLGVRDGCMVWHWNSPIIRSDGLAVSLMNQVLLGPF
jgi:hypothetical protein